MNVKKDVVRKLEFIERFHLAVSNFVPKQLALNVKLEQNKINIADRQFR